MNNRIFRNAGTHFYLWEESAWELVFNQERRVLDKDRCIGWTKTHIIVQKCATSGDVGLQILRFESNAEQETLELKANPYAGVYLLPEEWQQVIREVTGLLGVPFVKEEVAS